MPWLSQVVRMHCFIDKPNFSILDVGEFHGTSWLVNSVHRHTPTLCHKRLRLPRSFPALTGRRQGTRVDAREREELGGGLRHPWMR